MVFDTVRRTRRRVVVIIVLAGVLAALVAVFPPAAHPASTPLVPAHRLAVVAATGRDDLLPQAGALPAPRLVLVRSVAASQAPPQTQAPPHTAVTSHLTAVQDALADLRELDRTMRPEHPAAGSTASAISDLTRYATQLRTGQRPAATPAGPVPTRQTPAATGIPQSARYPAGTSRAATAVRYAFAQLGKPYVWGAAGPDAFDCSGLVMRAWEAAGVPLPHYTYSIWQTGRHITRSQLRPGDLVFPHGLGHVQIYIGGGNVIEAPHKGAVVRISPLLPHAYGYLTPTPQQT